MRKSILFITLFILTAITYSQNLDKNLDKFFDFEKSNKYSKAIKIGQDLVRGDYGELATLDKGLIYISLSNLYYYGEENVSSSYFYIVKYLDHLKDNYVFYKKEYGQAKVSEMIKQNVDRANSMRMVNDFSSFTQAKLDTSDYLIKSPNNSNIHNGNNDLEGKQGAQNVNNNSNINNDKTVTLTVTGMGETIEEARKNALRSAIELAFGAFISSKTEILNDQLVMDEMVSVSSGNILNFDIISEIELSNNRHSIILKATVSVTKLTSFAEINGTSVEYKGALFAANIRQQKMNEEAEYKAILHLCGVSNELLSRSLDFSVEASDPTIAVPMDGYTPQINDYQVLLTVKIETNNNYKSFSKYFAETIKAIAMSSTDIDTYNAMRKPSYKLIINDTIVYLRNELSGIAIQNLFIKSNRYLLDYRVITDLDTILINKCNNSFCNFQRDEISNSILYGFRMPEVWLLNTNTPENDYGYVYQARGSGFPNFSMRFGYDIISNWRSYHSLLRSLKNSFVLTEEDFYFTSTNNKLIEIGKQKRVMYDWETVFPSKRRDIGNLLLPSKLTFNNHYLSIYTESELLKLSFIKVEKITNR